MSKIKNKILKKLPKKNELLINVIYFCGIILIVILITPPIITIFSNEKFSVVDEYSVLLAIIVYFIYEIFNKYIKSTKVNDELLELLEKTTNQNRKLQQDNNNLFELLKSSGVVTKKTRKKKKLEEIN